MLSNKPLCEKCLLRNFLSQRRITPYRTQELYSITSFWLCLRHREFASSLPLPSAQAKACWGCCPQTPVYLHPQSFYINPIFTIVIPFIYSYSIYYNYPFTCFTYSSIIILFTYSYFIHQQSFHSPIVILFTHNFPFLYIIICPIYNYPSFYIQLPFSLQLTFLYILQLPILYIVTIQLLFLSSLFLTQTKPIAYQNFCPQALSISIYYFIITLFAYHSYLTYLIIQLIQLSSLPSYSLHIQLPISYTIILFMYSYIFYLQFLFPIDDTHFIYSYPLYIQLPFFHIVILFIYSYPFHIQLFFSYIVTPFTYSYSVILYNHSFYAQLLLLCTANYLLKLALISQN